MTREREIRAALRAWVRRSAGASLPARWDDRTPLLADGIIDSVQLMDLLVLVEELTGRTVDVDRLAPGAFRDIETIYSTFFVSTFFVSTFFAARRRGHAG